MKIEHVLFPTVFFKITDPFDGKSFSMCSHDPFFGTNKIGSLKTDRVNGLLGNHHILGLGRLLVYRTTYPR